MEKRMFIALILSLGILLLFQAFFKPRQVQRVGQQTVKQEMIVDERTDEDTVLRKIDFSTAKAKPFSEKETDVQTEKFEIIFSDIGGDIKELCLKEFEYDKKEVLFSSEDPAKRVFAIQSEELKGLGSAKYKATRGDNFLEYTLEEPGCIQIVKKYYFRQPDDYITLELRLKNVSDTRINFSYRMTGPSGMRESGKVRGRSFLEACVNTDNSIIRKRSVKNTWEQRGNISWVALKNRYFVVALKPFGDPGAVLIQGKNKDLATFVQTREYSLSPGETLEEEYLLYAGPVDDRRLAAIGYGMENIVDYGWFGGISKVLLSGLRFFHRGVKNWGIAIILLTMLINAITYPLTRKSFTSMHQMKNIQPHMKKLKEVHKDNPQKLNKEMMELYKKYKVNPFGGCLPMLLQIPIFIALYQGLIRSVELKGARFLWIKDLAMPDAAGLPISLPLIGNHINILPLLMVGMMVVQQKLSQGAGAAMTDEQASQQKMMMMMMPVFFGFLFYNMPSGLVLYWLTNTVLMSGEQFFLTRKLSA